MPRRWDVVETSLATFRRHVIARIEADLGREAAEAEARRARVLPLLRQAVAEAKAAGLCRAAWLFGSYAWGEPGERSDVDVLVEGARTPESLAALWWTRLDLPVHVLDVHTAPASLVERAIREGLSL